MAENDESLQADLMAACRDSLLFWTNAFAFTFKLKDVDEEGVTKQATGTHTPYITWDIQDRHLLAIETAINDGHDLLTDKSREMGASWNHILVLEHQFLFRPDSIFLELSRTEDYVDKSDNPKSLFWKHRYIRRWLPEWMVPPGSIVDNVMHFKNSANGSIIDGESTNANAASGDRRRAILLDEFAKVEQGTRIRWATSDVTACRLVNSTPFGAGTEYSKWKRSGQIKVFTLPWWEHPEKGRGRYTRQDEVTGAWKIRSPWYDTECARRSPQEVAQEIDMDDIGSGTTFFEQQPIERHRSLFVRPPSCTRTIGFRKHLADDAIKDAIMRRQVPMLAVKPGGPWSIWVDLVDGRPDQAHNYVFGIDISKGQGASNSVVSVICKETMEKMAEFADANTPPYELAKIVAAACIWFGGARGGGRPLVAWEANGPGWDFGRQLVQILGYPSFYFDRASGTVSEKQKRRYGWWSSKEKKEQMLGMLRRAYAHDTFINHSSLALDEALSYVIYDNLEIGPAELTKESEAARATHGDRVIADGLALLVLAGMPAAKPKRIETPARSCAWRREQALKRRAARPGLGTQVTFSRGVPEYAT